MNQYEISNLANHWKYETNKLNGQTAHDQDIAWHIAMAFRTMTEEEIDQYPEIREILTLSVDLHWQRYSPDELQKKWHQLIELLTTLKTSKLLNEPRIELGHIAKVWKTKVFKLEEGVNGREIVWCIISLLD